MKKTIIHYDSSVDYASALSYIGELLEQLETDELRFGKMFLTTWQSANLRIQGNVNKALITFYVSKLHD